MEVEFRAEPRNAPPSPIAARSMKTNSRGTFRRAAFGFQRPHHRRDLAPAVFPRLDAVGDGADAVVDQRPVDEAGPDVERVDGRARQIDEAPALVGVDDAAFVAVGEAAIEVDDAADEGGRERCARSRSRRG